jgi:hypothetical protein
VGRWSCVRGQKPDNNSYSSTKILILIKREKTQQKCSPDTHTPIMATKANKQKQQQSEETTTK